MIPPAIRSLRPMLAETPKERPEDLIARLQAAGGWYWEPKLDGHRALALFDQGVATLLTRNRSDITERFPEVAEVIAQGFPTDGAVVFDGELVCFDGAGLPNLGRIQQRAARSTRVAQAVRNCPATLVVFDLLYLNGEDLRFKPYTERTGVLRKVLGFSTPTLQRMYATSAGTALWAEVLDRRLEGLVAKRASSSYQGTRSHDWLKVKRET